MLLHLHLHLYLPFFQCNFLFHVPAFSFPQFLPLSYSFPFFSVFIHLFVSLFSLSLCLPLSRYFFLFHILSPCIRHSFLFHISSFSPHYSQSFMFLLFFFSTVPSLMFIPPTSLYPLLPFFSYFVLCPFYLTCIWACAACPAWLTGPISHTDSAHIARYCTVRQTCCYALK